MESSIEQGVPADVRAFVRGGVAIVVATRDSELRPEISRGTRARPSRSA